MTTTLRPVALAFFTFGTFWGGWAVAAADVQHDFRLTDASLGLLLGGALLGSIVVNLVAGPVVERWGTERALAVSLTAWSLLLLGSSLSTARPVFFVAFAGGVATGGAVDVVMNVAATAGLAETPSRLIAFHGLFNGGAVAGAMVTAGVLRAGASWRWVWAAVAVAAIATAVTCLRARLPAGGPGERVPFLEAMRRAARAGLLPLALVLACSAMVEGGLETWGVLYLRVRIGAGVLVGSAAYVLGQTLATAARLGLGVTRVGEARFLLAGGAGVAAAGLTVEAFAPSAAVGALGLAAAAIGISVCWPLLLTRATQGPGTTAVPVAAMTSGGYVGFVVGPPLVGLVSRGAGLRAGLLVLAALAAVVSVVGLVQPSRADASAAAAK